MGSFTAIETGVYISTFCSSVLADVKKLREVPA